MNKKAKQYFLAAGLGTATLIAGCDNKEKQWADAPGTRGFINLDAVQKAFKKDSDVLAFEKRVNEIFEGDNLIILESKQLNNGFVLTAKEDLDQDKKPSSKDEAVFILTVAKGKATLQGAGINSYYKESWAYHPKDPKKDEEYYHTHRHHPYFHYWYFGRRWGGYYTPSSRYDDITQHRTSYRNSDGYRSQLVSNMNYENQASHKYGSGFRKGIERNSTVRQAYINNTIKSGNIPSKSSNPAISTRAKSSSKGAFASKSSSSKGSSGSKGFGSGGFRGSSGFGI